ncbi:MAG: hypothetical protein U0667_15380 [Chloroflexota bacterium]
MTTLGMPCEDVRVGDVIHGPGLPLLVARIEDGFVLPGHAGLGTYRMAYADPEPDGYVRSIALWPGVGLRVSRVEARP